VLVQGASFAAPTRQVDTFRAELRYLVVHPDLVLPRRLVEAQVAPLARRDPAQLAARGLEVFNAAAEPVDAARANWSRPTALVVRQLPGPRSFLGTLRFAMPNADQVFLHGGPAEGEALPGSIRLEAPEALALALSGPPSSWTDEGLAVALAAGIPRTLPLARSIPVLYGRWSVWVDVDGTVSFRRGYEQEDAAIIAGLQRGAAR
jgi:murein L,D-transpeptidase YcbB/YkuD